MRWWLPIVTGTACLENGEPGSSTTEDRSGDHTTTDSTTDLPHTTDTDTTPPAPDCGPSFHTCDSTCPTGYQKRAASPGGNCGTNPSIMLFCVKG